MARRPRPLSFKEAAHTLYGIDTPSAGNELAQFAEWLRALQSAAYGCELSERRGVMPLNTRVTVELTAGLLRQIDYVAWALERSGRMPMNEAFDLVGKVGHPRDNARHHERMLRVKAAKDRGDSWKAITEAEGVDPDNLRKAFRQWQPVLDVEALADDIAARIAAQLEREAEGEAPPDERCWACHPPRVSFPVSNK